MKKQLFGTLDDGRGVYAYTLENQNLSVSILNYGGIIQSFSHKGTDIICGFDTIEDYIRDTSYQGALVGRFANRIKDGIFKIGGKTYVLAKNDKGKNHLHGGKKGFNRNIWDVAHDGDSLILTYTSPDGEEGYPGTLNVRVTYTLREDGLSIRYEAESDADTYVNLTNHSYFNLCGAQSGDILSHELMLCADRVTEVDGELIPTGRQLPVAGTPFDFNTTKTVGRDIAAVSGYDHNYMLCGDKSELYAGRYLRTAAVLSSCGRSLTVLTDKPCIQLYTANFPGAVPLKGGVAQIPHFALCLETQFEPNGPAHGDCLLRRGEKYDYMTVFKVI